MSSIKQWLRDPDTWDDVAKTIGDKPFQFDFNDASERTDAVQIVLAALANSMGPHSND